MLPSKRAQAPDAGTRVNWDDLLALTSEYQRIIDRADRMATVGLIGGLGVGALLLTLSGALGWPASLDPWLFGLGWATALGSAGGIWRWQRNELAKHKVVCATCGSVVVTPTMRRSDVAGAALAVATGQCPRCGDRLSEPSVR
jgi:ribosomal protein S27E